MNQIESSFGEQEPNSNIYRTVLAAIVGSDSMSDTTNDTTSNASTSASVLIESHEKTTASGPDERSTISVDASRSETFGDEER